jgi:hypothetical protein
LTVDNVVREDGQPDSCGSQSGEPANDPNYSRPVNISSPVTVSTPGGDVTVEFDVRQDIDGDEYVNVEGDDYEINIGFNGGEPSLPSPGAPTAEDGPPVEPSGTSGVEADSLTPEEEEEGFETIGYRWEILSIPSGFQGIPNTSPRVFPHVVGNVGLRYESAGGLQIYSDPARILSEQGSVFREDSSLKVTGVIYNYLPELGGIRLTPIRARKVAT